MNNIKEIRFLPMSKDEFPSLESTKKFIYNLKKPNWFYYYKRGINSIKPTLILFQYDASLIASAVMIDSVNEVKEGYNGYYVFNTDSITIFNTPITANEYKLVDSSFTNFNQSMRKTDIKYLDDVKNVISKRIPETFDSDNEVSKDMTNLVTDFNVWRISAGEGDIRNELWNSFKEKSYVAMGTWGGLPNLNYLDFNTQEELHNRLVDAGKKPNTTADKMIWDFIYEVKNGDVIIVNDGINKVLGIGIITGDFIPQTECNYNDLGYNNVREVKWISTEEFTVESQLPQQTFNKVSFHLWNSILADYASVNPQLRVNILKFLHDSYLNYYGTDYSHKDKYNHESEYINRIFNEILNETDDNIKVDKFINDILRRKTDVRVCNEDYRGLANMLKKYETFESKLNLTNISVNTLDKLSKTSDKNQRKQIFTDFINQNLTGWGHNRFSSILYYLNNDYYIYNGKTVNTINFMSKILNKEYKLRNEFKYYLNHIDAVNQFLNDLSQYCPDFSDFQFFDEFCHWISDKKLGCYIGDNANPLSYQLISNSEINIQINKGGTLMLDDFYTYLTNKCYFFDKETVENYLLSLKVKPFVILTGNSGTGKTKLSQLYSEYLAKNINQDLYKIVPVGANWTENRHILGYYNLISNKYQSTPSFDLIEKAAEDDQPYFLILDEMNLSHVERYFADFLSAIESEKPIPLYGKDEELEIPKNLFIIGTVNIDETTYMFSPKVLDRANTIEFDTCSPKKYLFSKFDNDELNGDIKYLENPLSDLDLRNISMSELKNDFANVEFNDEDFWTVLTNEITKFYDVLKGAGFDFGFRVIDEIVKFIYVAWKYEGKPTEFNNWQRYFDAQIKQKMLPKLHGSEKVLKDTLKDLLSLCEYNENDEDGEDDTSIKNHIIVYPNSSTKIKEMQKVLKTQRYVSFIN